MREELPEYIQRTFVYLIHSILRHGEEGLAGGMKSSPPCLSHYLKSGWSRLRNPLLSAQDAMPTSLINHGMLYSVHSESTSACFF